MPAITRSFSAPADLLKKAADRQTKLGLENFSDYIKYLIRADIAGDTLNEDPARWRTNSAITPEEQRQLDRARANAAQQLQRARDPRKTNK